MSASSRFVSIQSMSTRLEANALRSGVVETYGPGLPGGGVMRTGRREGHELVWLTIAEVLGDFYACVVLRLANTIQDVE